MGYGFEIEEIHKTVNYSTSGRGIVKYRIKGHKWGDIQHCVLHNIDRRDEGPAGYKNMPGLKELYRDYKRKGIFALFEDDAFMLKPILIDTDKVSWHIVSFKNDPMHFIVDLDRTFKGNQNFHYYWAWSKKDMFKTKSDGFQYFTQTKINSSVKKLSYQLCIGSSVSMKGLPVLIKISKSGKKELIKRLIRRPEPSMHESIEMTDDDVICNYYWTDILDPEIGAAYKIVWELSNTK